MSTIYGMPRMPRDVVHRSALDAHLDVDRPLTMVVGPDGLGKTVGVAHWLDRVLPEGRAAIWVSAGAATSSRLALWRLIAETLADAGIMPEDDLTIDMLAQADPSLDVHYAMTRSLRRLGIELEVVIDNFHVVTDPQVMRDLVTVVRRIPSLYVVLLSRESPADESVLSALGGDAAVVNMTRFPMGSDEIRQLVDAAGIADPDSEVTDAVVHGSHGVPIAVRALLWYAKNRFDDSPGGTAELVARLRSQAHDILHRAWSEAVSSEDIDFVKKISVADAVTIDLAALLTGDDRVEERLDAMASTGLGTWLRSGGRELFALNAHMQREYRDRILKEEPVLARRLYRIVGRWALRNELPGNALAAAVRANDLGFADTVLIRHWRELPVLYDDLIESLVPHVSRRRALAHPLIAALFAAVLNKRGNRRIRGIEFFLLAIAGIQLQHSKAPSPQQVLMRAAETAIYRVIGRYRAAASAARAAVGIAQGLTLAEREEVSHILGPVYTQSGLSLLYAGDVKTALELFHRATEASPDLNSLSWRHGAALIAGTYALQGELAAAAQAVENADRAKWPVQEPGDYPEAPHRVDGTDYLAGEPGDYPGAFYQVARALLCIDRGEFAGAQHHVDVMEPHLPSIEHWPVFAGIQAYIDLGLGRALPGAARLAQTLETTQRPAASEMLIQLDATRSLLLLAGRQLHEAGEALKAHPRSHPAIAVMRARIALAQGQWEDALAACSAARPTRLALFERVSLLLTSAVANSRLEREAQAESEAESAVTWMHGAGLQMPFLLLPPADRERVASRVDQERVGPEIVEWCRRLVAATVLVPDIEDAVKLTAREIQVLRELARSPSFVEIAAELYVSVNTVKSQMRSIYRKLRAHSREEALERAARIGLIGAEWTARPNSRPKAAED